MERWKRYGFAVARGALRAVPVAGDIIEEVLRVIEEDMAEADQALSAVIEATIAVAPEATISLEAEGTIAVQAEAAWSQLTEATRQGFAERLVSIIEDESGDRREQSLAYVVELTEAVLVSSGFRDAVTHAVSVGATSRAGAGLEAGALVDGRFKLAALIGQGGFGAVYRARDTVFDHDCALKVASISGDEFEARFRREAKVGFRLGQHPGVVRAYHMGAIDAGRLLYLVMDLVPAARPLDLRSGSLDERLERFARAARIVARVHDQGVIHRDLKPANFLQDERGELHLTDFGLAKAAGVEELADGPELSVSGAGGMRGTPAYMPPEQFEDFKRVDARADVYALGVMMFEALCGRRPFKARMPSEVMRQQMKIELGHGSLPDPSEHAADCPPELVALCRRALAMKAEDRVGSAAELAQAIEARGKRAPQAAKRAPSPNKGKTPAKRKRAAPLDYQKFLGKTEERVLPFLGGKTMMVDGQKLEVRGADGPGWYRFKVLRRHVFAVEPASADDLGACELVTGRFLRGRKRGRGYLIDGDGGLSHLNMVPESEGPRFLALTRARRWTDGRLLYDSHEPGDAEASAVLEAVKERALLCEGGGRDLRAGYVYALAQDAGRELRERVDLFALAAEVEDLSEKGWTSIRAAVLKGAWDLSKDRRKKGE